MKICTRNFENTTARRGLHCIWVPAGAGEPMRLVARWIDPSANRHENETHEEAATLEDVEARRRCLHTQLLAA